LLPVFGKLYIGTGSWYSIEQLCKCRFITTHCGLWSLLVVETPRHLEREHVWLNPKPQGTSRGSMPGTANAIFKEKYSQERPQGLQYRPHAAAKPTEMNRNVGTESARVSETTRSAPYSLPLCWRTRYCCFIHSILVLQHPSGYRQYGQSYPCTSSMARKRRSSGPRQSRDFAAICWSQHN